MKIVFALRSLAHPGGLQTFALTLAEHLLLLGHDPTLYAPQLGMCATAAQERGLQVTATKSTLSRDTDATLATDKVAAIDMARCFPNARRLFLMHNYDPFWLPTLEPGVVAATLAPNDRLMRLAQGCVGAGRVVRIRQPIDLYRFPPRGAPAARPTRILALGNYAAFNDDQKSLRAAWDRPDATWRSLGGADPSLDVAESIAWADIVVGYGRVILEAMACGRAAYVHEHAGSDGWATADSYAAMEADGFSGVGVRSEPTFEQLRADLDLYRPELGAVGHGLVRAHHDARLVAADVVAAIEATAPPTTAFDPQALATLRNLSAQLFQAQRAVEQLRVQARAERMRLEARISALTAETLGENTP